MLSASPMPSAQIVTHERTASLSKTPRAPRSEVPVVDRSAKLNVPSINIAQNATEEAEGDARTPCCKWDEHGERLKPFRKRTIGATVALKGLLSVCTLAWPWKPGGQPATVDGAISVSQAHQWQRHWCPRTPLLEEAACIDQLKLEASAACRLRRGSIWLWTPTTTSREVRPLMRTPSR